MVYYHIYHIYALAFTVLSLRLLGWIGDAICINYTTYVLNIYSIQYTVRMWSNLKSSRINFIFISHLWMASLSEWLSEIIFAYWNLNLVHTPHTLQLYKSYLVSVLFHIWWWKYSNFIYRLPVILCLNVLICGADNRQTIRSKEL